MYTMCTVSSERLQVQLQAGVMHNPTRGAQDLSRVTAQTHGHTRQQLPGIASDPCRAFVPGWNHTQHTKTLKKHATHDSNRHKKKKKIQQHPSTNQRRSCTTFSLGMTCSKKKRQNVATSPFQVSPKKARIAPKRRRSCFWWGSP